MRYRLKKKLIKFLGASLLLWVACAQVPQATVITDKGETMFKIELAETPKQRATGLMNRKSLPDDFGMLFIWEKDVQVPFWMKNTYVALDIIFLDHQDRVVAFEANTKPLSTEHIVPEIPFRKVLEVKAGFAQKSGLKKGDQVHISY